MKRAFDIIVSGFAILLVSPVLLIIMIVLSLTGEREIFFLQSRIGFKGNPFRVYKFATMHKNSDRLPGGDITLRNDPRVTKVGRFLRSTKLNELPQLFNVFSGDMSVVGPRPLMKIHYDYYPLNIRGRIYDVKPGMTGIASVILRDEEFYLSRAADKRSFMISKLYPFKGSLEMWYQKNISVLTDLKLIFLTIWMIIFPKSNLPYRIFDDLPEQTF